MVLTGGGRWRGGWRPTRGPSPGGAVERLAGSVAGRVTISEEDSPTPPRLRSPGSPVRSGSMPLVRRDDAACGTWFGTHDAHDHRSGVLGLCPLQGIDRRQRRFEHPCYVAHDGM